MSLYEMGIDIAVKSQDKKWLETQKGEVLTKIDDARHTVRSAAIGVGAAITGLAVAVIISSRIKSR